MLVINKPPGIHSVDLPEGKGGLSLASLLAERFPETRQASIKPEDSGLVNRLDHETSGLVLVARSREVWERLRQALLAGEMEKHYLALVEGITPARYEVEAAIGAKARRSKKVAVVTDTKAKQLRWELPAKTIFQTVTHYRDLDLSLVRAEAHMARRHQIRAHSAHAGHVLVGDALYGSQRSLSELKLLGLDGSGGPNFMLHAESIKLSHPLTGSNLDLKCAAWIELPK